MVFSVFIWKNTSEHGKTLNFVILLCHQVDAVYSVKEEYMYFKAECSRSILPGIVQILLMILVTGKQRNILAPNGLISEI